MSQATSSPTSGRSSRRLLLGAGLVAAAGGAGLAWWRHRPAPPLPGAQLDFWQEAFETPDGQPLRTIAWQGKPLLVNFWATWCPPCVEELPMLEAFWQARRAQGWTVLGLAVDQPSSVKRFLQTRPLSFPIGMAGLGGTELSKRLGNSMGALPFSVLFGKNATILKQKLGKLDQSDLDQWAQAAA